MKKRKEEKERALKQHSALTTFTSEQKYFNPDTEKALFTILYDTQNELQKLFTEIYTPYIDKLFKDEKEKEKLLESIYITNSVANIDLDFSKIIVKEIPEISKKVIEKKIEAAHSALIDKTLQSKYLLEIEGLDIKQLTSKTNSPKLIYKQEELVELLDNIKEICKYETLNRYGRTKIIDFTALANKLEVNSKRLKVNIEKATNVQLRFNYIDKKKLNIETISNLIASITFIMKSKVTWMKFQIPDEILKLVLMPKIYVSLQEKNIHKLKGKYSIRAYTFLKDHLGIGSVTITKEECKTFFQLPDTYINNKRHFINKFLNPTIAELQTKNLLRVDYELIPEYNFQEIKFTIKQMKEEPINIEKEQNTFGALEILEIDNELQKYVDKAKRNIYVSRTWNKRVDNKIIKLLKEEGKEFTKEILIALYDNLNENIKTTLVQYINGIIKNKKINKTYKEEKEKKKIQKKLEKETSPEILNKEESSLQKVTRKEQKELIDALSYYEIEDIRFKEDTDEEISLYDKCVRENRLKVQNKFIVSEKEYLKEHKRYTSQGYLGIKATELMNKMFIVKEEE